MADPPAPRRRASPTVRVLACVVGLALLLLGVVLVWNGSAAFIQEAGSGDMDGRDVLAELLVVGAGGGSLVLALVAARVGEVI